MDTTAERIAILKRLHHKWMRDLLSVAGVNPDVAFATAQALRDLETWHVEHEHEQALPPSLKLPEVRQAHVHPYVERHVYLPLRPPRHRDPAA